MSRYACVQLATPSPQQQTELFAVEQIEGYGSLKRKERLFVQAIVEGCSQKDAAERAGILGNDEYRYAAGSRLIRSRKVQKVLNQAWVRSGASIDLTLRQAAEIQARAFHDWKEKEDRKDRKLAFNEWLRASTLLAGIHGKLQLKVENHTHLNHVVLTPQLMQELVQQRRGIVTPLINSEGS